MLKTIAAALFALLVSTATAAAVDANKASQAELEAISGVGPVISAAIVNERKKSEFKDWNDLFNRIRGVGDRSAAKFSQGGMTVAGKPYPGPPYVEPVRPSAAASSAKAGAKVVKGNVKEEKDAAKASVAAAKATAAEKKAAKADTKAAAASAAKK